MRDRKVVTLNQQDLLKAYFYLHIQVYVDLVDFSNLLIHRQWMNNKIELHVCTTPRYLSVIYINFIKEQFLCLNTYFAHDRIMQNMWYKNHDVIMMLLWWKCALLLVYKYMYFILLNLRRFLSWLFLQVSSSKMKILGKGNNQYCLFVYQYYLFEFNELFSNPCKNSKESLNTTQFGEYLNN